MRVLPGRTARRMREIELPRRTFRPRHRLVSQADNRIRRLGGAFRCRRRVLECPAALPGPRCRDRDDDQQHHHAEIREALRSACRHMSLGRVADSWSSREPVSASARPQGRRPRHPRGPAAATTPRPQAGSHRRRRGHPPPDTPTHAAVPRRAAGSAPRHRDGQPTPAPASTAATATTSAVAGSANSYLPRAPFSGLLRTESGRWAS